MRDLVYPPVTLVARGVFRALGLRITVRGGHNVPLSSGAVIASNHVSYLDFALLGYGVLPSRRYVRFMAKESVFRHRVSGPLMRSMHHIPVDRAAGSGAFKLALDAVRGGELIGVFPEATISRSFLLKEFKPGAVRLAQAGEVPLVPAVVWGGQRVYTKGHPKHLRGRGRAITVAFGEPMSVPRGQDPVEAGEALLARMAALLDDVQRTFPDQPSGPDDLWWLPASLGGTAPTPEEAAKLDAGDRARREGRDSS